MLLILYPRKSTCDRNYFNIVVVCIEKLNMFYVHFFSNWIDLNSILEIRSMDLFVVLGRLNQLWYGVLGAFNDCTVEKLSISCHKHIIFINLKYCITWNDYDLPGVVWIWKLIVLPECWGLPACVGILVCILAHHKWSRPLQDVVLYYLEG